MNQMDQKQLLRIDIYTAAQVIGRCVDFIRWGLQQGTLPFGVAVKCQRPESGPGRYSYLIDARKLADFAGVPVEFVMELNKKVKTRRRDARQRRLAACKK